MFINKYAPVSINTDFELPSTFINIIKAILNSGEPLLLIGYRKTSIIRALLRDYYHNDVTPYDKNKNIKFVDNICEHPLTFYLQDLKIFCTTPYERSSIQNTSSPPLKKTVVLDNIDCVSTEHYQHICSGLIETYSSNINFILSARNMDTAVIPKLLSQSFVMRIPSLTELETRRILHRICVAENILFERGDAAMSFLLRAAQRNLNVAINYLEKLVRSEIPIVTLGAMRDICTDVNYEMFDEYFRHVKRGELGAAINMISEILKIGCSVIDVLEGFGKFYAMCEETNDDDTETRKKIQTLLNKYTNYFYTVEENECDLYLFTGLLMKLVCCH